MISKKKMKKLSIRNAVEEAEKHDGYCLSAIYENSRKKLRWECTNKHIWEARLNNVRRGQWCRLCNRMNKNYDKNREAQLSKAIQTAKDRGGRCLSNKYEGCNSKQEWECYFGHKWKARYLDVKKGRWCPYCRGQHLQETIVRIILEHLLGCKMEKIRPIDLFNDQNNKLEFDFWSEKLKIAGEHQGYQHFYPIYSKNEFAKLLTHDRLKKEYCANKNIVFFETIDFCLVGLDVTNIKGIFDYVKGVLLNKSIKILECEPPQVDLSQIYKCVTRLEKIKQLAQDKGGECLSDRYVKNTQKLRFICNNKHVWETTPANIKNGYWCPYCAKVAKLTIIDMHKLAEKYDGKCLSAEYINNHSKLSWRCSKNHEWMAVPANVKNGHWCPKCAIENSKNKSVEHIL